MSARVDRLAGAIDGARAVALRVTAVFGRTIASGPTAVFGRAFAVGAAMDCARGIVGSFSVGSTALFATSGALDGGVWVVTGSVARVVVTRRACGGTGGGLAGAERPTSCADAFALARWTCAAATSRASTVVGQTSSYSPTDVSIGVA